MGGVVKISTRVILHLGGSERKEKSEKSFHFPSGLLRELFLVAGMWIKVGRGKVGCKNRAMDVMPKELRLAKGL